MANFTANYNLTKPLQTEYYDVDVFNENADIVDSEIKSLNDSVTDLNSLISGNFGTDGYIVIGGLLVQWGAIEKPDEGWSAVTSVYFNKAFGAVYNVQLTANSGSAANIGVAAVNATYLSVDVTQWTLDDSNSGDRIYWFVIGTE